MFRAAGTPASYPDREGPSFIIFFNILQDFNTSPVGLQTSSESDGRPAFCALTHTSRHPLPDLLRPFERHAAAGGTARNFEDQVCMGFLQLFGQHAPEDRNQRAVVSHGPLRHIDLHPPIPRPRLPLGQRLNLSAGSRPMLSAISLSVSGRDRWRPSPIANSVTGNQSRLGLP